LERQLASHTRGAIHLGATPEQVLAVLELTKPRLDPDDVSRMEDVVRKFIAAW
ncbi:MAG: hypothetical protein GY930_20355, partial [bacterium]|nr:hypothetical protein [bacterium]